MKKGLPSLTFRQSNVITQSKVPLSVHERRLLYHILLQLQSLSVSAQGKDRIEVVISVEQLSACDEWRHMYRDYRQAADKLMTTRFLINAGGDKWIPVEATKNSDSFQGSCFISYFGKGGNGIWNSQSGEGLVIGLSPMVYSVMTDVLKNFTVVSALAAFTCKSKYSQRFYEWCCQWGNKPKEGFDFGWFYLSPKEINDFFGSNYNVTSIKNEILEVAQKEIKQLYDEKISDYTFQYEPVFDKVSGRRGRGQLVRYEFKVFKRRRAKVSVDITEVSGEDVGKVLRLFDLCSYSKELKKEFLERLQREGTLIEMATRTDYIISKFMAGEVANLGGYVRTVMEKDLKVVVKNVELTELEKKLAEKYGSKINFMKGGA